MCGTTLVLVAKGLLETEQISLKTSFHLFAKERSGKCLDKPKPMFSILEEI